MELFKDDRFALWLRTFSLEEARYLTISLVAGFGFDAPDQLLDAGDALALAEAARGERVVLDLGLPKLKGEVLLLGKAYAASGQPTPMAHVRLAVAGAVDKTLRVHGDRDWDGARLGEAKPFVEMPLGWEQAYGGPGFAHNPYGKGYALGKDAVAPRPWPNLETPETPAVDPAEEYTPAGFGALELAWPLRAKGFGGVETTWLCSRAAALGDQFDLSLFNAALADQQVAGFLQPGGEIVLEGMDPEREQVKTVVPPVMARVFLRQLADGGERLLEAPIRLETLWLFPDQASGLAIWRGLIPVAHPEAEDIRQVLAVCEPLSETPLAGTVYTQSLPMPGDEAADPAPTVRALDRDPGIELPEGTAAALGLRPPADGDAAAADVYDEAMRAEMSGIEAEYAAMAESLGIDPNDLPEDPVPTMDPYDMEAKDIIGLYRANGINNPQMEAQLLRMEKETKLNQALVAKVFGG